MSEQTRATLQALRAELNPYGWGVLHDPWTGHWLVVRAQDHIIARNADELRQWALSLWHDTVTMPAI